jgi:hypothetical protein
MEKVLLMDIVLMLTIIALNKKEDAIPPKPKDLGILANFI